MLEIKISRGGGHPVYIPSVLDGASWETGAGPGRFTFAVWDSPGLDIGQGDAIEVRAGEAGLFKGTVFTRRTAHTGTAEVTAYDQKRYLKNRDTVVYDGITASALLRRVANEHRLKLGTVTDTKILLEPCAEDNKALADILRNALSKTEAAGGGRFVLVDDFGLLSLRKASEMRLMFCLRPDAVQTFEWTVSIDRDTYNSVKLVCEKKGKRAVYTASDSGNISRWGFLQHLEKAADDFGAQAKAGTLLGLYNRERSGLFIGGAAGDPSVRAGCSLTVGKEIAGTGGDALRTVERARHVWKDGRYFMDLELTSRSEAL